MKGLGLIVGGGFLAILAGAAALFIFVYPFLFTAGFDDSSISITAESVHTEISSAQQTLLTQGELKSSEMGDSLNQSARRDALLPNLADSATPLFVPGKHLKLTPQKSQGAISLPGVIQFLAELKNPYNHFWQVRVEATVTHADGSTKPAITSRVIWLLPGQTLKLPIKFRAREPRYQPGLTLFEAFIKDMNGNLLDQASITFTLLRETPESASK